MKARLEVVAHDSGPWLVRAGRAVYAVPAAVGQALAPLAGSCPGAPELQAQAPPPEADPAQWAGFVAALADALSGKDAGPGRELPPAVWLRLPLVPQRMVRWLAARLAWLAGWRALALLVVMGLAGYTHLGLATAANPIRLAPGDAALALALFLVTALWHELGHAAALARAGYPPGGIGAGLLFVIPVLYADVTAVGVLPRGGRLRVDAAGMVFQFGLGGGLAAMAGPGHAVPALAAWLALVAVAWSLLPFIRADGYWLLCDLLEVPELERDPAEPLSTPLRCGLGFYRLANAAFLLAVGFLLPWRLARQGALLLRRVGLEPTEPGPHGILVVVAGAVLVVVWGNIVRRAVRLVRAAF